MGGKLLLKLNIGTRPIANKYREGKMKSTLKRKLRVRETVSREAHGISNACRRFKFDVRVRFAASCGSEWTASRCNSALALLALFRRGASTSVRSWAIRLWGKVAGRFAGRVIDLDDWVSVGQRSCGACSFGLASFGAIVGLSTRG